VNTSRFGPRDPESPGKITDDLDGAWERARAHGRGLEIHSNHLFS
jgi:hypothetical protein